MQESNEHEASPHPWDVFLEVRCDVIDWMREEMKKSDFEIARDLSMDERQVFLIRNRAER